MNLDPAIEQLEEVSTYKLSEKCMRILLDSYTGWVKARLMLRLLGGPGIELLDNTPENFLVSTTTDAYENGKLVMETPCPPEVIREIKSNWEEALRFVAGLQGSV